MQFPQAPIVTLLCGGFIYLAVGIGQIVAGDEAGGVLVSLGVLAMIVSLFVLWIQTQERRRVYLQESEPSPLLTDRQQDAFQQHRKKLLKRIAAREADSARREQRWELLLTKFGSAVSSLFWKQGVRHGKRQR
ncbi:hypothetical protein ACTXMB_13770 [Arthrobacter rhombi]|uniref:hypothetical protein n=1 Tax=Arthrobacter rhombi TaxID=71253 RepID=UPI003FD0AEAB